MQNKPIFASQANNMVTKSFNCVTSKCRTATWLSAHGAGSHIPRIMLTADSVVNISPRIRFSCGGCSHPPPFGHKDVLIRLRALYHLISASIAWRNWSSSYSKATEKSTCKVSVQVAYYWNPCAKCPCRLHEIIAHMFHVLVHKPSDFKQKSKEISSFCMLISPKMSIFALILPCRSPLEGGRRHKSFAGMKP